MRLRLIACSFAVLVLLTATARADLHRLLSWNMCWPNCVTKTCCDDYCPKPMPCVKRTCNFGCDDYCPKPMPCVKRTCNFGCDDYCPKCPPTIRCAPTAGLKCVPMCR